TLGAMVYALVASMTSAPLSEPAVGVICWLLLGMASGVADALEQSAGRADQRDSAHHANQLVDGATLTARATLGDAARGRPLRTLFVVDATASDETRAALTETIRAFDRRRVIPQVMTLASPIEATTNVSATTQGKRTGARAVTGALRHWVGAWRRWAELLRVILDARPDLIVATSPRAYLPTVFAGRLVGAPVQWHAREVAAPGLQRALDTFAPWASGIVACSQYVARSFQIEALGSRMRVVRLGVAAPAPVAEERRRELRAALGVADADPLIIYPGPIVNGSGHADLIQAMRVLRARHPHAMLLLASETGVGGRRTTPSAAQSPNADLYNLVCADPRQGQRLACAISLNRLDGAIQALGLRADLAAVIAACDLAVFPQWAAPVSRGLTLTLSQGVPIVAVQAGALPEQLADAWGCLLAPPRDPAALADALSQAITRLGALREDARHNRSLVRDWQSAGIEAARLQTLYRQLCLPKTRKRTRSASQPATPPPPKTATPVPLTARSHAWAATLWSMGRE
ncbi:MAG TPA: glycosyltransferase family 4 protein, partial [Ktedonobacterales bacterium]|nr:glycosyltransferase family 4 protein [Ktedonobacterales bacterium]